MGRAAAGRCGGDNAPMPGPTAPLPTRLRAAPTRATDRAEPGPGGDAPLDGCHLDGRSRDEHALLARLQQGPASGDALAAAAGVTRAAIWKRIQALRAAGVEIQARPGRGYALARPLVLLDAGAIVAALPPAARAELDGEHAVQVAWTVDSTNTRLLRQPAPARGCAVLLAERQTAGRGRRGRSWASPLAAHLYLSVARGFRGGLGRLGGLSLVAGVAAAEALAGLGVPVRLKWPNDLVVDDGAGKPLRKLGGLLVEGGGEHAGPVRAVVGLGLNVRMPVASAATIDQPWCDLAGLLDAVPDRNRLAALLLARMLPALRRFDEAGLAPFLPAHAAYDALAGREVVVEDGGRRLAGTAQGLAADGALQVRVAGGGIRAFHAGEVSIRAR
jgi:BirA family transcriptional regulator, biotin operon repressor / biotin---[acetyl-CoA-carboxylase] ligase